MSLPPITTIVQKCKHRKVEVASLISFYEKVSSLDLHLPDTAVNKLPRGKEYWLMTRFGLQAVKQVCSLLQLIPESMTDAQQIDLLTDFSDVPKIKEDVNLKL